MTGGTVAGLLSAIIVRVIAIIIVVMKSIYAQRSANVPTDSASQSSKSPLDARTKYPWADAFKYSGIFLQPLLALALGLTILAFSWTQYEEEVYIPDDALVFDEEIEIEPPRTAEPPPPPSTSTSCNRRGAG